MDSLVKQSKIKVFLTDVDGVLTDGGMYYSENGDELKKFNTRDGMGMQLLREAGLITGIITSEVTDIVQRRAKKLKVDHLYQGKRHDGKLAAAKHICEKEGLRLKDCSYIGDDINCIELLQAVGLAACPSDAMHAVRSVKGIQVMKLGGGQGVVRELAEFILKQNLI